MARERCERGISYDPEKNLYYACLSTGTDANGKSTKRYVTTKTLTEARAVRKEHNRKKAQGQVVPASTDTLVDRIDSYITYKKNSLSPSTIYGYEKILKNHLSPYFKKKKIQNISVSDIKNYTNKALKSLSPTTVRKHLDLLSAVFKEARREKLIIESPFDLMDKIQPDKKKKNCYDAQKISLLLNSVIGTPIELPVFLAAYLGLRRGEILGLKWEHVDLENRIITICNSKTQVGDSIIEKKPKTEKSNRKLGVPQPLYDALLREKNRTPTSKSMKRSNPSHSYVVRMKNGDECRPNYISEAFKRHLKKHNFSPIKFHDLRHSYASIAAHAGASIQEISYALGHASISITSDIYTHELSQVKTVATDSVTESISAVQNKTGKQ